MQIPEYFQSTGGHVVYNFVQFSSYGEQLFILILCVAGAVVVTANQCLLVLNVSVVMKWTE